jgi:biotin carboxylase
MADAQFDSLRPELRSALTEYYRVSDMHNYDELLRALGHFTHRYGKLDRIDSQNEYWLESEARLRTDFNITGLRIPDLPKIKQKSEMKRIFNKTGVITARGVIARDLQSARQFIEEVGYPVIAKPDIGVGANKTYKLQNDRDFKRFFAEKPPIDYFMEEFIEGTIITFDGLTDRAGEPVFSSSLEYCGGVMEAVNEDTDFYYYTVRKIPADLEKAGRKTLRAFGVRERFFHFEFFRKPDGSLVGLEVNIRPPGGLTMDMFNYANDIDMYREWANIVVNNRFQAKYSRPYYCGYIGRKTNKRYVLGHEQVLSRYPDHLVHHQPIEGVFSAALGNYGYLVRSPDLDEILQISHEVLEKLP